MKSKNKKTHPEILEDMAKIHGFRGENPYGNLPAKSSGDVYRMLSGMDAEVGDINVSVRVTWGAIQWARSGKPILKMSDELRDVLLKTDVPDEVDVLPNMPFDGMYLIVDGGFDLFDKKTGDHQIEGIYVAKDRMRRSADAVDGTDGLLVMAVGEDKGGERAGMLRDDTIQYFGILPNAKLKLQEDQLAGFQETLRVVLNLLFLWNVEGSPVTMKTVTPTTPKSPAKKKKLDRRGYSTAKYIELGIKKEFTSLDLNKDQVENWSGPTHISYVRGHFRKYWVTDPKDAQVIAERTSDAGKKLFCIRRFIAPHRALRRGEEPGVNIYKVRGPVGDSQVGSPPRGQPSESCSP